jgi:ATP/maltotriose-dependent transcriptional regulator MalT
MRDVLLALALTSNARISAYDANGGGTPDYTLVDDRGRAKLARGDAPHLLYADLWDLAGDVGERQRVLEEAVAMLEHIRRSSADRTKVESKADRDERIIKEGKGFSARDVANAFRCGVTDIWRAREAAGRDIEFGEPPQNGKELPLEQRNAEILRLYRRHLSTREIAVRLNIARSSVRYVLARADLKVNSRR